MLLGAVLLVIWKVTQVLLRARLKAIQKAISVAEASWQMVCWKGVCVAVPWRPFFFFGGLLLRPCDRVRRVAPVQRFAGVPSQPKVAARCSEGRGFSCNSKARADETRVRTARSECMDGQSAIATGRGAGFSGCLQCKCGTHSADSTKHHRPETTAQTDCE